MAASTHKSLMDVHPRELKGFVKEIPTLPVIFQELFQKMQDPDVDVPQIAEVIAQDQSLSTKVLHLVNSAFYGYSTQIKTISRAVVILGFKAVRSVALAISVLEYFGDEESGAGCDMIRFWTHSIAVACICKILAAELHVKQQEEAFVVGLLHDVGKIIEKRYFSQDFADLCEAAQEQQMSWIECEQVLFQINHATIGKAVFRAWKFPPTIVDAIHFHHAPEASTTLPQLAALVHVADFISYRLGYGAPGAMPPKACSPEALKLLNVTLMQTIEYHDKIESEMQHSLEILKLLD